MTLEHTRDKLKIIQYARIVCYITNDIHDYDGNVDTIRRLHDAADLAEELAEDARKLAADLQDEVKG